MTNDVFYGTKIVRRIKNSTVFHFEKWWGFKKGELVKIHVCKQDGTGNAVDAVKKVCETGNSYTIFLDCDYGFKADDIIIV